MFNLKMKKNYDNEKKLVLSLLNNDQQILDTSAYIKENFNVDSIYDVKHDVLYMWGEESLEEAYKYASNMISENTVEIVLDKPEDITLVEKQETVFVVYYEDGTMFNYFYDKEEAEAAQKDLKQQSPANKPFIKEEPLKNFVRK